MCLHFTKPRKELLKIRNPNIEIRNKFEFRILNFEINSIYMYIHLPNSIDIMAAERGPGLVETAVSTSRSKVGDQTRLTLTVY